MGCWWCDSRSLWVQRNIFIVKNSFLSGEFDVCHVVVMDDRIDGCCMCMRRELLGDVGVE